MTSGELGTATGMNTTQLLLIRLVLDTLFISMLITTLKYEECTADRFPKALENRLQLY